MFGSNDDKKSPAAAGEKKGLFGWLLKKPQETVVEQPQVQAEPIPESPVEAEQAFFLASRSWGLLVVVGTKHGDGYLKVATRQGARR